MLTCSSKSGHSFCFFLIIERRCQYFAIEFDINVGFFMYVFYYNGDVPFYFYFNLAIAIIMSLFFSLFY